MRGHGANFDVPKPYVRWFHPQGDIFQVCIWTQNIPYVPIQSEDVSTHSPHHINNISAAPAELEAQHAHARFAHVGNSKLDALAKMSIIPAAAAKKYREHPCSDCKLANATRDSYPHVDSQAQLPGEVLHADLLRCPETTLDGKKYALMSICEHTRYVETSLLTKKSDA